LAQWSAPRGARHFAEGLRWLVVEFGKVTFVSSGRPRRCPSFESLDRRQSVYGPVNDVSHLVIDESVTAWAEPRVCFDEFAEMLAVSVLAPPSRQECRSFWFCSSELLDT